MTVRGTDHGIQGGASSGAPPSGIEDRLDAVERRLSAIEAHLEALRRPPSRGRLPGWARILLGMGRAILFLVSLFALLAAAVALGWIYGGGADPLNLIRPEAAYPGEVRIRPPGIDV